VVTQLLLVVSLVLYGTAVVWVGRLSRLRRAYGYVISIVVIAAMIGRAAYTLYKLQTDSTFAEPPLLMTLLELTVAALIPLIVRRVTIVIQHSDDARRALQTAHDEMEYRILARTADLEAEMAARERATAALSASVQQMRLIVQNLPVMVNAIDDHHQFALWNRESERVTGYSADEMIGNPDAFAKLYPDPEYRAQQVALFEETGGNFRDQDVTITCKDGRERVIAWSNVSGQYPVPGWRGWAIGVDITERKRAENALREARESLEEQVARRTAELRVANEHLEREIVERRRADTALRRSENQLRATLDALGDYVHVVDKELRITLVNKAFFQRNRELGLETHPIGRTPFELFPFLPEGVRDEYQRVFATGDMLTTVESNEIGRLTVVTETRKIPILDEGEVTHVVTVTRDISEQREAQDRLHRTQFITDHAPVSVFWTDVDAQLIYVNETACAGLGYTHDELLAMHVHDIDPNFPRDVWLDHWAELKAQGQMTFESFHRAKDGREYPVEITTTFLTYDGKEYHCAFVRDISRRKQTEKILRQTQFASDHAPDGIAWINSAGQYVYVNRALTELLGYTRDEFLTKRVHDIHPAFPPERWAELWDRLKTQPMTTFETALQARDGQMIPIEVTANYLEFDGQDFVCAFSRDITKRKQAEEALRQSEDRFKQLYERAPLGYQSLDKDGYFVEVNRAWLDLLGYERGEVIGRWFGDFLTPASQPRFKQAFSQFKASGTLRGLELEMTRKDGTVIVASFDGRVGITVEGEIAQLHCIVSDITERKQAENALRASEERFRVLVDSMDDVIFTLDTEQRYTVVYGRWLERMGMTPDMFLGKTAREFLGREAGAVHEAANARALVGEHVVYEWSIAAPDGEIHYYQTALSPMLDADGNVTGLVGVGRDISALKQAEKDAIRLALEQERRAILANFIRDTSHEFANPLSVIKNSAYLATHTPDPNKRRRHLEMIDGQVFHVERLVEGMIMMSRLDGGVDFNMQPLSLDDLFTSIPTRLQRICADKNQITTFDIKSGLPQVMGDEHYLRLALQNLLDNAIAYTPPGGTITIKVARATSRPDHIVISIADTGIGIAQEHIEHIFERFYRVDKARTKRGAGLGLPIAQAIIEAHDGTITVESTPDQGSVFRVFLPIHDR
jgi:PAS domain S-box-containing protein